MTGKKSKNLWQKVKKSLGISSGSMNKEEAIQIIQGSEYWDYYGGDSIVLDGHFTVRELESFMWLMQNNPEILKDWDCWAEK